MLGVERDKISLSPHDSSWAQQFAATKEELLSIHSDNASAVYHVGSTAVKGIAAKPILDVALVVRDIQALNIAGMERAGYEFCGERGVPGRFLFVKRRDGHISTHHIHCYTKDHEDLRAVLLFCQYLNDHPAYAKQYNDLKTELAAMYPDDRLAYTDGKTAFISMIAALSAAQTRP